MNIQLLACGAALVFMVEWIAGEQGGRLIARDVTILLNLLWGAIWFVQQAVEP